MTKGSIHPEDITNKNVFTPSLGGPKYIKQSLPDLKAEIGSNAVIKGDPIIHFQQWIIQINKEIMDLKYTLDQMDLTYIHRTFHPRAV